MSTTAEVIEQAHFHLKRIGDDVNTFRDNIQVRVTGIDDRIDRLETTLKRGGGAITGKAETSEEREYKSAFDNFVRTGEDTNLKAMQRKALSSGSDPDGGYLVPSGLSGRIVQRIFETSPIRQIANVQTVSTGELELLVDGDEAEAVWADEVSPRATTKTPQLGKRRIVVHGLTAAPLVTERLLEDSAIDVAAWLERKLGDKFTRTENASFVKGSGVGQPRGFLTYPAGEQGEAIRRVMSGAPSGFPDGSGTADALLRMVYSLKAAYRSNASWLMPRAVQLAVRTLKDERGNYLWQPGIAQGQPDRLLGYPVYDAEDMPGMAAGSLSIAFGDWREGYTIVDRLGIRTLRDPYTKKPFVEISAKKRVGGDVVNPEALVILQTGI